MSEAWWAPAVSPCSMPDGFPPVGTTALEQHSDRPPLIDTLWPHLVPRADNATYTRGTGALTWQLCRQTPAGRFIPLIRHSDLTAWDLTCWWLMAYGHLRAAQPAPRWVSHSQNGEAAVFVGPGAADFAAVWALDHTPGALVLPDSAWGLVIPQASLTDARIWFARVAATLAAAGRSVTLYAEPLLV
jgi:hypothetical protein